MTDRRLSHMHGFSAKVRVILTDEWPDDFRKVGIKTLRMRRPAMPTEIMVSPET